MKAGTKTKIDGETKSKPYQEGDEDVPHFCQCGCGKSIEWKDWYRYQGIPRFLRGHYSRRRVVDRLPEERDFDYQNPDWLANEFYRLWISPEEFSEKIGITYQTLNKYMKEGGFTVQGLAERKARALAEVVGGYYASEVVGSELNNTSHLPIFIVFMPGSKAAAGAGGEIKVLGKVIENRIYDEDGRYQEVSRKVFVEGYGLAYTSKLFPSPWREIEFELKKLAEGGVVKGCSENDIIGSVNNVFQIVSWKIKKIRLEKEFLIYIDEGDLIEHIHQRFGEEVEIEWTVG